MGSKASVICAFEEKEIQSDNFLLQKLVREMPLHLQEVNKAKTNFVIFAKNVFIPKRESALNELKEVQRCIVDETNGKVLLDFFKCFNYIYKILIFISILLSLFNLKVSVTMFVTSITIDGLFYHNSISKREYKRKKLHSLLTVIKADRNSTTEAKNLWKEFSKSCHTIQKEIDDFVRNISLRFSDVQCKNREIKQFLSRIVHLKPEIKSDLEVFLHVFRDLIDDYSALCSDKEALNLNDDAKLAAWLQYQEKSFQTASNIEMLVRDLDLCFKELEMTDTSYLTMLILLEDPEYAFAKINETYQSLSKENESLKEVVALIKQK